MDAGLLAWGRAVKQRRRSKMPVLWLFTDARRLPDPLPAIARLPPRLCGVVFRHDDAGGRAALALRVAKLCKARHLPLVVAGDARLAAKLGAGVHLRGGRWPGHARTHGLITASAHRIAELRRARRAGAKIIFLSPLFPTATHPGAPALGTLRWAAMARNSRASELYCLGGVTGKKIRLLGGTCAGAGAIEALSPEVHRTVISLLPTSHSGRE